VSLPWIAVVLLAGWSLDTSGALAPPSSGAWLWLAAGSLAMLASRGRERERPLDRRGLLWLLPAAALTPALGTRWVLWSWLLALAAVVGLACARWPRLRFLATGLATTSLVLGAQAAATALHEGLGAQAHWIPGLAPASAACLRLLGLQAGSVDGVVLVSGMEGVQRFIPSWDHLGLLPLGSIAAGAVPLLWLHGSRLLLRSLALVAVLALYAAARFLTLIVTFGWHGDVRVFWSTTAVVVSFLPVAWLLARVAPLGALEASFLPERELVPGARPLARVMGAAACASFLLAGALGLRDPGLPKAGRVLFDERHSDWEWTEEPFDTERYGLRTSYNYFNLYDHLDHYFRLSRTHEPLSDELLAEHDVLVLRTPTEPFAEAELAALQRFVERGGGLWLIGDHTNVFGSGEYLNAVAERFGIRFQYDCTYDLSTGSLNLYRAPEVLAHPVVSRLPPFLFATSCTVRADWPYEAVMVGTSLNVLPADYGQPNFFPAKGPRQDGQIGSFLQAAARRHGAGRVLAFTDSTVFSNFFMYLPGKPELALGSIDWLNRTNRLPELGTPLALLGLATLAWTLVGARGLRRGWSLPLIAAGSGVGLLAALALSDASVALAHPPLEPRRPARRVHFDLEHSGIFLPILRLQGPEDNDWATFYTWTQRIGLVPTAERELERCLAGDGLVLLADPVRELESAELEALRRFVAGGGGLLVLLGERGLPDASDALLESFGLAAGEPAEEPTILPAPFELVDVAAARPIHGGRELLVGSQGRRVGAWVGLGGGRVVVVGCGGIFSAAQMGSVSVEPSPRQREIYELEYALLRFGLGEDVPAFEGTRDAPAPALETR
jgi:hypothetical protein